MSRNYGGEISPAERPLNAEGAENLVEAIKNFYGGLPEDTKNFLDIYGFNETGRTPEALLMIKESDEKDKVKEVWDAIENFHLAAGNKEKQNAARALAKAVDETLG